MSLKETHKLISKELSDADNELQSFFHEIEKVAAKNNNARLKAILKDKRKTISHHFPQLIKQLEKLKEEEAEETKKKSSKLLSEIEQLKKAKDIVVSNNFLLEYKKKDLLILADNLEDAYEEISAKNRELEEQKRRISEQAEKIRKASEEILEKNDELEQQKEAILDQADYLHEANQTITSMHEEVRKQKDEILKKNEELISLNNEKNNLIGIVAHDLKSPLNQIKGLISIIKVSATELDEDTRKYIDIIESSATRLNEMIAKILDIEAIESKSLNLKTEKTNLSHLLAQCVERYKITAKAKSITINQDISPNLYAMVDPDYTNQVYENLISNALKFSPKYVNVYVNLQEKDGATCCEVKDEGPGISESDMKKLFGKYQKLSAKPTGNETSTGLGLSIVKKFVEAMDGRIWCESEVEKGASFFVSFKTIKN